MYIGVHGLYNPALAYLLIDLSTRPRHQTLASLHCSIPHKQIIALSLFARPLARSCSVTSLVVLGTGTGTGTCNKVLVAKKKIFLCCWDAAGVVTSQPKPKNTVVTDLCLKFIGSNCLLFTALHGMQTRSSDENSVRLSVTRVHCDKTVERSVQIYIPYERTFSLVFRKEEWLVGATPSSWNFGSTGPRWRKIADFQPIIARSASAVTPSEKSSINANRESTTRFSMSLRWSSYVAPKYPKGSLKNEKRPICVKKSHFAWRKSATKFLCVKTVSGKVVRHSLA